MVKKILTIAFLTSIIVLAGYVLVKAYSDFKTAGTLKENDGKPIKVTLEFWGLWDNSENWDGIIKRFEDRTYNFNGQNVNIHINYTKENPTSYREDLLRMKQKGSEPNIFMINNNWLKDYIKWLSPLESDMTYAQEYNFIKYDELFNTFIQETLRDLIYDGQLYGFPMYSDSLALYYNKDLFEKAGIKNPPRTWKEFKEDARKLTIIKNADEISQSGVAMGEGKNINRSSDIIALLAMQSGARVVDAQNNIDINKDIEVNTANGIEKRDPGKKAILFYTEFSDPEKDAYSWDSKSKENSMEAFANKKTAMMFNYSYQIKNLLAIKPDLNYGISHMPQLENSTTINFANVWTPVVSKSNNCKVEPAESVDKIDCSKIAWSFLSFAAQKENTRIYLDQTGKAAARKDLITEQINSGSPLSVFASQAETAISYNKFNDEIDEILSAMIDEIVLNRSDWEEIVNKTAEQIEKLKK